jgi:hypothetical protein
MEVAFQDSCGATDNIGIRYESILSECHVRFGSFSTGTQRGACITRNRRQSMGRSRGGLTSKIHAVVDTNGLPVRLALTAGDAHDNRGALGPTYRREAIATNRSALARISTERATWSSGSSIRSSNVGGSRRATTSSRPTTWPSSNSLQFGCGYALMSPLTVFVPWERT